MCQYAELSPIHFLFLDAIPRCRVYYNSTKCDFCEQHYFRVTNASLIPSVDACVEDCPAPLSPYTPADQSKEPAVCLQCDKSCYTCNEANNPNRCLSCSDRSQYVRISNSTHNYGYCTSSCMCTDKKYDNNNAFKKISDAVKSLS